MAIQQSANENRSRCHQTRPSQQMVVGFCGYYYAFSRTNSHLDLILGAKTICLIVLENLGSVSKKFVT